MPAGERREPEVRSMRGRDIAIVIGVIVPVILLLGLVAEVR